MARSGVEMGRPKRTAPDKRKFKTLAVRATEEFAEWAERGAEHSRMNLSTAVELALIDFFKARGFEESPPKRY